MLALTEGSVETESESSKALQHVSRIDKYSGAKKTAILILSLGDDAASEVMKHLSEAEVHLVSKELALLRNVPSEISDEVIAEFHQLLLARSYVQTGGIDYAKKLLNKSFGGETAKRLIGKIRNSLESPISFEALQKVDPQQLAKLFQSEHPQAIAVVLAHLEAPTAAATIENLPENYRSEIAMRMATLQTVSHDVIRRIATMLNQKLSSVADVQRTALGGVRTVAEICNRLDRNTLTKLLEQIEESNPDLATEIRNLMLTFDDILLIDDIGIREILQRADKKTLALALKGTTTELQNRFFSNMSSRAVEMMREEMDFMGQVKMKDVTGAQREIVEVVRVLEDSGFLTVSGGGGGDEYVS